MTYTLKYLRLVLLIFIVGISATAPIAAAESDEGILVGRIAHLEGTLLRYVAEEKDWVVTVKDAPFGLEDTLYSEDNARAEFILPNDTWIRVGENTQLQLIALRPDATTVDVASGSARLYNKGNDTLIKVTTPFGYVVAPDEAIFDLYVGDESVEVIVVRGDVDFIHDATKYEVKEGSSSIIADRNGIAQGNGTVDAAWDDWNDQRDRVWATRLQVRGYSADFLPEPIREESYALEENGRWERVYYEGAYRDMWRPTRVDPGWRPFTAGRWTVYYGDNCWIPDEPFGYVTHHYGAWVYIEPFHAWYWTPPLRGTAGAPSINLRFGWYPGRVGWIHSGESVGWVPLASNEVYYGSRPWGHRTVVVGRSANNNIDMSRYRYLNEAVIIPRHDLYRGTRYTPVIERTANRTTLLTNYKPTAVINNAVINTFSTDKSRFAPNDAKVVRRPHSTVLNRIDTNQQLSREAGRTSRQGIAQDLNRIRAAAPPVQKTDIPVPRLTSKLVDPDKVTKPINESSSLQKEIKPKSRERQLTPDNRPSMDSRSRGSREQGQVDLSPGPTGQDTNRGVSPPRDRGNHGAEQANNPQGQEQQRPSGPRLHEQPKPVQGLTPDLQRPEQVQRSQQEEAQKHQQELQQRQQQDTQRQQQEQVQIRQQEEAQKHQQELQQRQQQDAQRQQQEQVQRRQQEEAQKHQQEFQQRQQQDVQRQQQEQVQRGQQEEAQRHQQELQQRQQQDVQRQQQEQGQRRQQEEAQRHQQELQQRQQQDAQRQQQEQGQRRQQEEAQRHQQELQQRHQQEGVQQQQQGQPRHQKTPQELEEEKKKQQQQ